MLVHLLSSEFLFTFFFDLVVSHSYYKINGSICQDGEKYKALHSLPCFSIPV